MENTMTTTNGIDASLKIDDRVEKLLIPLHCNDGGKDRYGKQIWHVHFDDLQMRHYYLMTSSEPTVRQIMAHVNSCVKVKFIVAGIRQFENCVRIKNVSVLN